MDLHAAQIQGFFKIPVDDLYALPVLCNAVEELGLGDLVVVSPDPGFARKARLYADRLGADLAVADKERIGHEGGMRTAGILGEVADRCALIVDDFTVTGGTLAEAARGLVQGGAREVHAAITHGLFTEQCMAAVAASPIRTLLVTDTIETQPAEPLAKVRVVSVAPLFAEAIRRIHTRQSISVLFQG
jgi:ribose-phosphate pyrophosphokinase